MKGKGEMKDEYITSEVPAFGKLVEAIRELTEAGLFRWRNHVDSDHTTLRLKIFGLMRSPEYNRGAVGIEVGGYRTLGGYETKVKMPNYSFAIVAGDEPEKLNAILRTYAVDTDETDVTSLGTGE